MNEPIDLTDANGICRICLKRKSNLLPIFSIIEFENETFVAISIADALVMLTSESTSTAEGFPGQICDECKYLVKSAILFKFRYEKSTSILKDFTSKLVQKEENANVNITSNENWDKASQDDFDEGDVDDKIDFDDVEEKIILDINYTEPSPPQKRILHPCPICPKELPALELRKHAHTHKALKKYLSVPKINKNATFYAPPRHTVSIFNKSDILHNCPYCKKYYDVEEFRTHVDRHRKEDVFSCDKCDRVFSKINYLSIHRLKHLKEFPYKCETCGKGFVIKKNYDCHIITHSDQELPHECKFCHKRFSNPEHLHRHSTIHTENVTYADKYRVFKCNKCLRSFKDKDYLKEHQCVPIEKITKMRYPCKVCHKVFRHKSGLYNHDKKIHKQRSRKTLCSVCGCCVDNIYNHMMRHQGLKPFKCNLCKKEFSSKTQLCQHLLVHSGVKPYICSVCGKTFNNIYNLQVHERLHRGDRCHICHICNKGFLEKSYLRKHLHIHKIILSREKYS